MGLITKAVDLVNVAVRQIQRYQTHEDAPIKTRFEHFNANALGGIFKGNIITIGAISGSGKSYVLQQIEEDMFNKQLNPSCDDYVLLRCNWEMTVFKLLIRKLKRKLRKSATEILFKSPEGDDLNRFKDVCDSERSDKIFYLEAPTDPKTWYDAVRAFLEENKHKKHVVVTIDHIALVRDVFGSKKTAMDTLIENINMLKKEFINVSFIILSQLNRDIEGRTDIQNLAPKRSDLYNSDTIFHISDIVLVLHNPFKLGHSLYMNIPGLAVDSEGNTLDNRYAHLHEYMERVDNKWTHFLTAGNVFWHYLKVRELEDNYIDIAVEPFLLSDGRRLTASVNTAGSKPQDTKTKKKENMPDLFGDDEDDDVPY